MSIPRQLALCPSHLSDISGSLHCQPSNSQCPMTITTTTLLLFCYFTGSVSSAYMMTMDEIKAQCLREGSSPGTVLASSDVLSGCQQYSWTACEFPALRVTPSAVLCPRWWCGLQASAAQQKPVPGASVFWSWKMSCEHPWSCELPKEGEGYTELKNK